MAQPTTVLLTSNVGTPTGSTYLNAYVLNTPIIYTLAVGNTGGSTVTHTLTASTSSPGATAPILATSILMITSGQTLTTFAIHTASSVDVTNGSYTAYFTIVGNDGKTNIVAPLTSNLSTSGLSIAKVADMSNYHSGTVVTYSYWVQNGRSTSVSVSVADSTGVMPAVFGSSAVTIQPGSAVTFTAKYTATTADVTAGYITNVATLTPGANQSTMTIRSSSPSLTYAKTTGSTFTAVGETIVFGYLITNVGSTPGTTPIATFGDFRPGTAVDPVQAAVISGTAVSTGRSQSTSTDVASGYLSNTGYVFVASNATTSTAFAGMGLTLTYLGPSLPIAPCPGEVTRVVELCLDRYSKREQRFRACVESKCYGAVASIFSFTPAITSTLPVALSGSRNYYRRIERVVSLTGAISAVLTAVPAVGYIITITLPCDVPPIDGTVGSKMDGVISLNESVNVSATVGSPTTIILAFTLVGIITVTGTLDVGYVLSYESLRCERQVE